ncbi:hypothetical protein E2C01_101512 [Portunus trituberculatus]|uniref:Uncharacterized protein n=1 Tax=Portunus trituberculatus TaxID=210409 RepID=A0A5B7KKL6_PORTR|nr:hypothetical protein [Portunus trituberculatus]
MHKDVVHSTYSVQLFSSQDSSEHSLPLPYRSCVACGLFLHSSEVLVTLLYFRTWPNLPIFHGVTTAAAPETPGYRVPYIKKMTV